MKQSILLLLMSIFATSLFAQSAAINTDGSAANTSSILDIKSTTKGLLIPRMTTAQRTAIATPAKGLIVFDISTNSFWFHDGMAWEVLSAVSSTNYWSLSGSDIYNNISGNVGIGTTTPLGKLHIAGDVKINGNNSIEFGADVFNKELNAGKIGYQTFTPGALDIDVNSSGFIKNTRDANLFADKKNNCLWVMNVEIEKLDRQKNKFTLYTAEKILKDPIFKFSNYTDPAGASILVSDFGLYQYDKTNNQLLTLHSSAPLLAPGKSNIFLTDKKNEEAWISSWDGLTLYYNKTKTAYTHDYNPIGHPLLQLMDKKELRGMLIDSEQNYWISTGGLFFTGTMHS